MVFRLYRGIAFDTRSREATALRPYLQAPDEPIHNLHHCIANASNAFKWSPIIRGRYNTKTHHKTTLKKLKCFLKPEGIVLSLFSVHASGSDHFEAELLYSDLQEYYLPAQMY